MNERDQYIFEFMMKIDSIRESSDFALFRKIRLFRTSFSVYSENYCVLMKTLNQYYANSKIHSENSVKRWRKQRLVVKDIHNLISSAKSYIDDISKMESTLIVQEKIDQEFKQNPLYHFIRALRNFLLHEEPLSLVSRSEHSRLETGQLNRLIYESMDKSSFEKYLVQRTSNGKNSEDIMARQYLEQLPDKINLNTVIKEFDNLLGSFHNWFILDFVNKNKSDLQKLYLEIEAIHQDASENSLTQDHPITKAQLRHLDLLIKRSEIFKSR